MLHELQLFKVKQIDQGRSLTQPTLRTFETRAEWGIKGETGCSQMQVCVVLLPPKCPYTFPSCCFPNSCCPLALTKCLITGSKHCKPAAGPARAEPSPRPPRWVPSLTPGDRMQTAAVTSKVGPSQHLQHLLLESIP